MSEAPATTTNDPGRSGWRPDSTAVNGERYLMDAAGVSDQRIELPGGHSLHTAMLLDGSGDGPEASRARFSDGFVTLAHFHLGAQFQLLTAGTLEFPDFTLSAPAVHYTDHHVAYGPFTVRGPHEMYVLHAKPAGVVCLDDDRSRLKEIDQNGREIVSCAQDVPWLPLPDQPEILRKELIPATRGPRAEMLRYPPGAKIGAASSAFGRFDLVHTGSMIVNGHRLGPGGVRFVASGCEGAIMMAGATGLELFILEFDSNAAQSFGGNNLEAMQRAAQELTKARPA